MEGQVVRKHSRSRLIVWACVSLLLCVQASSAGAKPPGTPARSARTASTTSDVLGKTETFATALVALRAFSEHRGVANHEQPLYALLGPTPKAGKHHVCAVELPDRPRHCAEPGPRPPLPSVPAPPCAWCDESRKQAAWADYIQRQLADDALHALLALNRALGYFGQYARLSKEVGDALGVLKARGDRGAALSHELARLVFAKNDATREDEMERLLQSVISASGLSLGAEDLSTEGGLEAAIKLCGSKLRSSRVTWQTEFAKWAMCRNDAIAGGKRALASEAAANSCNEVARDYGPSHAPAWKAVLEWETRAHAYDVCLESNAVSELAIAKPQTTPCAAGSKKLH